MRPWYKTVIPRKEVREGRSFSPDEFAIALEQVVAGTAPLDYRDPAQFFSRTCFTRALTDHAGLVLRRLTGRTENTAPVLTLITQFGGGKTHTLTSLYHLANTGPQAAALPGVPELLREADIVEAPSARVGVFVGNAWDPAEGRETPWIDLARQLAGDQGVAVLGDSSRTTPPGTEALTRVFAAANGPVLLLFDEVLNFVNRHRGMAEKFHAFVQNLTVAVTGSAHAAAVISLPRSQVEMTAWDQEWQDRITKVVRRVARDLIANDESEISEVVRRRLFEDLGPNSTRERVARTHADWCFERSAWLPSEWTSVDTAVTRSKGRQHLRKRFEACYPFHPATLSVFQRKWRALPQFQQTRGALAMLAQWISWAAREQFRQARDEPLITLGSAPLHVPDFRAVVLGQLGESRLDAAVDADLAAETAHAGALDADTKGPLRDIHRRVGTAILFESSGGQVDKVAHLPELRFALGGPDVDTTTIDNAASALERAGFFMRKVGTDGYRIHHQATLRKVVSDRRASLDEETEIKPALHKIVQEEFERGSAIPLSCFPTDGDAVGDSPRLTVVVLDPSKEWHDDGQLTKRIGRWTRQRGKSPRLYPSALVWCVRKPGRDLRDRVELLLAWKRVAHELAKGILGADFERADSADMEARVREAEEAAKDEVWAGYRFVVLSDAQQPDRLKVIDLGAGHSSSSETLCGRIIAALKSQGLLNETVGAGYIERNWPPAFKDVGAWPMVSLRQSFLDGALTRLIDPDRIIRQQVAGWVQNGDFGLASGDRDGNHFQTVWFEESVGQEEIVYEPGVFLLTKDRARVLRLAPAPQPPDPPTTTPTPVEPEGEVATAESAPGIAMLRVAGTIPPEAWNRFGRSILPKLQAGDGLRAEIELQVSVDGAAAGAIEADVRRAVDDMMLSERLRVEREELPRSE
jgi:hypothetical protein